MSDAVTFWIVKGTLVALALASALTWAIVVAKGFQQWQLSRQNAVFAKAFGSGKAIPSAGELGKQSGPVARVALAGVESWDESDDSIDGSNEPSEIIEVRRDLLERGLRKQIQRERRSVENGLPILASIGSTSPFIGLFGTVLGIIHALYRISGSGSASLDVVAGPIGEALIATGIGIAVAVPAILAYNFFLRRLKTLVSDLEEFANAFVDTEIRKSFRIRATRSVNRPISSIRREASA